MSEEPFERMLVDADASLRPAEGAPALLQSVDPAILDYLEARRDAIIMELHGVDDLLLACGRLKRRTIPRRAK